MTTETVVYWEYLLDETGATVLDEAGDPVLVPMANGMAAILVEAGPDPIVEARTELGLDVDVVMWCNLVTEASEKILTEAGEYLLIPVDGTYEAIMVDAFPDTMIVTARED